MITSAALMGGCIDQSTAITEDGVDTGPTALQDDGALREKLDHAILLVFNHRRLNLKDHAAWQIVHGALAFKRAYPVLQDGKLVSAIDHVLAGGAMNGWEFEPGVQFENSGRRGLRSILRPGSKSGQGHADQWLGYLAECGLAGDEQIRVGNDTYLIGDIVAQAEWDVPQNVEREYSWTLMALTSYRPTTHTWLASDGRQWTIEDLVNVEVQYELEESACGGTHRMYGLAMALNRHLEQEGKLTGAWELADKKIRQAIAHAKEFQNPDGSFSSNYFERPGTTADMTLDLGATGHVLEFLTLAMPAEQVREPWMKRAAVHLCNSLEQLKDIPLECGALYHATHGLVLYRERLYGPLELPDLVGSATPSDMP
jgi:hypothetical protein